MIITPDPISDKKGSLDSHVFRVALDDAPNPAAGVDFQTVGFTVTKLNGGDVADSVVLELAVFSDEDCTTPSLTAILSAAVEDTGEILAGSGSAAIKVRTNDAGEFQYKLTNAAHGIVYLACSHTFGSPSLSCQGVDSVTFTA